MVLSAGLQKAGTGWYFNLANDMLIAAGYDDARAIRSRYRLGRFMTEANCNIGTPTLRKMVAVSLPALLGKSYVLKTHEGPTPTAKAMLRAGLLKATYIYRDPRDVVVSLYEHGERLRQANAVSATGFDKLDTYEAAIEFVEQRLPIWRAWAQHSNVYLVRYEQLIADPVAVCKGLARHLRLILGEATIERTVQRYSAERAARGTAPHALHFNKGISGRWRELLTAPDLELCENRFGPFLAAMGYPA